MTTIDVREAEAGPALDAACAEAMGWEFTNNDLAIGAFAAGSLDGGVWFYTDAGNVAVASREWNDYWWPSKNITAAWVLQQHVDPARFCNALVEVVMWDRGLPDDFNVCEPGTDWVLVDEDVWALVTATAHQRARAFLLANDVKTLEVKGEDHG